MNSLAESSDQLAAVSGVFALLAVFVLFIFWYDRREMKRTAETIAVVENQLDIVQSAKTHGIYVSNDDLQRFNDIFLPYMAAKVEPSEIVRRISEFVGTLKSSRSPDSTP